MLRGFVNLLKPTGMTSNDAVCKVRGILRAATGEKQKVGHLGTLDPLATGVLPISIGRATKLFDYMQNKSKRYVATFAFGKTSETLDLGSEIKCGAPVNFDISQLRMVLSDFTGDILQTPPQYSAKSIGGRRAYDIARSGSVADLKAKTVHIERLELIGSTGNENEYAFDIVCGSGTYIRAIARDVATALGTVGLMSSLKRTECGDFRIENSVTLEEFEKSPMDHILPIETALCGLEKFEIPERDSNKILNGATVKTDMPQKSPFLLTFNGETVAIGENVDGKLHLKIRL